jgi:hypothetical protein
VAAADAQTTIATFFTAMNAHDADAAAALVDAEVEIVFGSQVFSGPQAVRELALQEHPDLVFETTPVGFGADGDRIDVTARRVQRWREGGEIAVDESVRFSFALDSSGLIARVELS